MSESQSQIPMPEELKVEEQKPTVDVAIAAEALDVLYMVAAKKNIYIAYPKYVQDVLLAQLDKCGNNGKELKMFTIITLNGFVFKGWALFDKGELKSCSLRVSRVRCL